MLTKSAVAVSLVIALSSLSSAEDASKSAPAELEVLKGLVGVWDAEIEVWANGPDNAPFKFKGVETARAYGQHWITSDFESEFMGQTMKVHTILGYDLDKKALVGTIIDHGPYKATATVAYDAKSKTEEWTVRGKELDGTPMVQKTTIKHNGPNERLLVMKAKNSPDGEMVKFMQIKYVKRK